MKLGIIGGGSLSFELARKIAAAGHDVVMTAENPDDAGKIVKQIGPKVRVVPSSEVAKGVDLLIAATSGDSQVKALKSAGDLKGKIVIDITNPLKPDYSGFSVGLANSFAEELAKELPGAKIIKVFNTTFAQVFVEGPDFGKGVRAAAFFCGDDDAAKKTVQTLVESMGFDAIDAGPLVNARYLEPMGFSNIWYGSKRGIDIIPAWVSREEVLSRDVRAA
jgi:predicted dinucleotide-binding enzyme